VQEILGRLRSLVGGNIEEYTRVCDEARKEAFQRMVTLDGQLGADAIVGMRYDATEFAPATTEVLAYGTAVKLVRGGLRL
jgi:uncharacterized protein YbjQ (UPF0145 family)